MTERMTLRFFFVAGVLAIAASCANKPTPNVSPRSHATAVQSTPSTAGAPTYASSVAAAQIPPTPASSTGSDRPLLEETPAITPPEGPANKYVPPEDPNVLVKLSAVSCIPKRFLNASEKRFSEARGLFERVRLSLRHGSWRELKRARCGAEQGGDVTSDSAAIVVDADDNVKALTLFGGTDDHYHELRSFFDEAGHLRLLFVRYADVYGGVAEHLVYFKDSGAVAVCDNLVIKPGLAGWDLCTDEEPPPKVASEVARAMQPRSPHVPRNQMREELQKIDPRQAYKECAPNAN